MSVACFSPTTANKAVGKSQASIDNQLLGLLGPQHQHTISTFNTCSWGPTHRSLTDTNVGYNLGGVGFSHHTPRPSQLAVLRFPPKGPVRSLVYNYQQFQSSGFKEPTTVTWSFDHTAPYHGLYLCLAKAIDLSIAIGLTRDQKVILMQLRHHFN
jgi:hypothetical protein